MNDETLQEQAEELQALIDEAKVVRDFTYTPEGKVIMEKLERMKKVFEALRGRRKTYDNPIKEAFLEAQWDGVVSGVQNVINLFTGSSDEVKKLSADIKSLEQREQPKQVNVFSRVVSSTR